MLNKISTNVIKFKNFTVKKETLEWWLICLILIFSFINPITLLISLILLLILLKQNEIGAIKILNLITLRTIINPGIAANIQNFQYIKFIIIFICSFYLILGYVRINTDYKRDLKIVISTIIVFLIYNSIVSAFFSKLPVVAVSKLISFGIPFLGIIIGITNTHDKYDWINWMYRMMKTLFLFSIFLINSPVGYLKNGHAFQGLTNHPNVLGILSAFFIALIVAKIQLKKFKGFFVPLILISLVIYVVVLSKSRTGFISVLFILLLFLIFLRINRIKKMLLLNLFILIVIFYVSIDGELIQFIREFMYKGQNNIFYSRANQLEQLWLNFIRNPWFGNGFAVPITSFKSFAFSTEYVVEPGNFILAILSYSGIIGFTLFLIYMSQIFKMNKKEFRSTIYLFVAPLLISMGEMVLFSSNNIGIWCYMFFALSMVTKSEYNRELLSI